MENKFKQIFIPTVVLTAIGLIVAILLGLTNLITKDRIAALESKNEAIAISKVIEGETAPAKVEHSGSEHTYYIARKDGKTVGYAFKASANGYGGTVKVIVGINLNGTISGIEITDTSSETPGLGQNVAKDDFTAQFKEKDKNLSVVKQNPNSDEIKAVTGATISSKAVTNAVNSALELYKEVTKGGAAN